MIGAFASLVELALILGVIFADGNIRWAMLILAALFFASIVGPFSYILIRMNWVLYPPKDYGGETGVSTYVEAMSLHWMERKTNQTVQTAVREIMISSGFRDEIVNAILPILPQPDRSRAEEAIARSLDNAAGRADLGINGDRDSILVFLGPRTPSSLGLQVGYESTMSVREFIVQVSTMLHRMGTTGSSFDEISHYLNYGTAWILRESSTDHVFEDIGPLWSWRKSRSLSDLRRLPDTDLKPGMDLVVDRVTNSLLPISELPFKDDPAPERLTARRSAASEGVADP